MTKLRWMMLVVAVLLVPALASAQPETPVEEWTGKTITDDDLDQSIAVYNENRRLLHGGSQ